MTELGIGASTVQGARIGQKSVIGGQAMVTKSIPDEVIAVGVPAKVLSAEEDVPKPALYLHKVSEEYN